VSTRQRFGAFDAAVLWDSDRTSRLNAHMVSRNSRVDVGSGRAARRVPGNVLHFCSVECEVAAAWNWENRLLALSSSPAFVSHRAVPVAGTGTVRARDIGLRL